MNTDLCQLNWVGHMDFPQKKKDLQLITEILSSDSIFKFFLCYRSFNEWLSPVPNFFRITRFPSFLQEVQKNLTTHEWVAAL